MHTKLKLALLLAGSAWAVSGAEAQSNYRQTAFAESRSYGDSLARDGYRHLQTYTGFLRDGQTATARLTLSAGTDYAIAGGCDDDCRDLDFALRDLNGQRVEYDRDIDSRPLVFHSPGWGDGGTYSLDVSMARCTSDPCFYVFQVYGR